MDEDLLTLNDVADELGLHYMTVYRYVRSGQLPAIKHRGGWRVERSELSNLTIGSDPATRDGSRRSATQAFTRQIRVGDEPGAWAIVQRALTSGADPWEVHTRLLSPAVADVVLDLGAADDDAARRRALVVANRVTARLAPRFRPGAPTTGRVLLAIPSDDHIALPLTILADLCRLRQFDVAELGAHTPLESMIEEAHRCQDLVAICIHSSAQRVPDALPELFAALRTEFGSVPLVLSTLQGAEGPKDPGTVGADDHGAEPAAVVAHLERHRQTPTTD